MSGKPGSSPSNDIFDPRVSSGKGLWIGELIDFWLAIFIWIISGFPEEKHDGFQGYDQMKKTEKNTDQKLNQNWVLLENVDWIFFFIAMCQLFFGNDENICLFSKLPPEKPFALFWNKNFYAFIRFLGTRGSFKYWE